MVSRPSDMHTCRNDAWRRTEQPPHHAFNGLVNAMRVVVVAVVVQATFLLNAVDLLQHERQPVDLLAVSSDDGTSRRKH